MDKRKFSVVIVDDCPLYRKGIADVLTASAYFQVLGLTGDEKTALSLISLKPDIVIIDLDAKEFSPLNLLREVKYRLPTCRAVMMMSSANNSNNLMQAIRLDANGYLLRNIPIDEFLEQIEIVSQGGMAASEKITSALAEHLRSGTIEDVDNNITQLLTKREFEVLCCVAAGLSNSEIATFLDITDGTVKVHVKHLLKKLKFRSRVEAAVWAAGHDYRIPDEKLEKLGLVSSNPRRS
ncbi:LuxR C-terminal-related transcriptional regulator [Sutterella sp.]|uniref:LuxR C-terminal-related transcriptional regulator n=1 Tax=Sutterella sp. TaxID=1981025 RepID=UPI0026E0B60A|nr:LuxR C-terminal-related transcriptional regulator [Sutterella sp.]MDO5530642.1 LuxR C-terminal-related transcriptional regulator [Sutterella sp.]